MDTRTLNLIRGLIATLLFNFSLSAEELLVLTVEEPPSSYLNQHNVADGYSTEIVRAMLAHLKVSTKIEIIPEARALTISEKQPNVLLFSFSRTPFREDKYYWIGELLRKSWHIYAIKNTLTNITSINVLREFSAIGVVRGDVREEWLLNKGFKNLQSVTQHQQNVQLLLLGRRPVIAYESLGLQSICNSLQLECDNIEPVFTLNTASGYILMSKPNTSLKLVKQLQHGYQHLIDSGQMLKIATAWQATLKQQGIAATIADNKPILVF